MKLLGIVFVIVFAVPLYYLISMGWTGAAIAYSLLLVAVFAASKQMVDGITANLPPPQHNAQQARQAQRAATLAAMRKR